eukprot:933397-Pyramimonas_sp.AAC.1
MLAQEASIKVNVEAGVGDGGKYRHGCGDGRSREYRCRLGCRCGRRRGNRCRRGRRCGRRRGN